MTIRKFQAVFYSVLGLCILIIVTAFTSFDFIEVDTAVNRTMRYFAVPILIAMTPVCYFVYLRFLRQHEKKAYKSQVWTRVRTVFRIFIMTLAMTGIFIATTLSIMILTNAYFGDSKTINLNAKVVDYYTSISKGSTRHYIKIQDQQLDRIIEMKVDRAYQVGQVFNRSMQVGQWGLLYANE